MYRRGEIISAMQKLFRGPAVHVSPPAGDLLIEDLLFLGFRNSFHSPESAASVCRISGKTFGTLVTTSELGVADYSNVT